MKRDPKNLRLAFVLSTVLHALVTGVLWLEPFAFQTPSAKSTIVVELMDPDEALKALGRAREVDRNGQIVNQDEKPINDEVPADSKLLSRHNQTVRQQTQATLRGKFNNSDNTGGQRSIEKNSGKTSEDMSEENSKDRHAATDSGKQKSSDKQRQYLTADDGVPVGRGKRPSLKDLTPSFRPPPSRLETEETARGGGSGVSATDDHLKDVRTGMQTLLSTREFIYFSYYNRIKDKLRQYWEPKIKEKMERIVRQGRTIASETDRITRVVIVLDKEGTLIRVQILGASGVHDLDDAAVEAFKAAAPFPNPPAGIVERDGTIKIRWDFILEANANGLLKVMRVAYQKE